jgi:hypothetical protein
MNPILKDYQRTHRNIDEDKKKHISVGEGVRIFVYAVITLFVIHVVYKGFQRKEVEFKSKPEVLKVEEKE